ncbi:hypothetical protein TNCV_3289501 [Trichonephila clavipes]|nr:hypothetical protein TNCV_3289501 [Trichonephila clavipes]
MPPDGRSVKEYWSEYGSIDKQPIFNCQRRIPSEVGVIKAREGTGEEGVISGVVLITRPWFKIARSVVKSPQVAERGDVNIHSLTPENEDGHNSPVVARPPIRGWCIIISSLLLLKIHRVEEVATR